MDTKPPIDFACSCGKIHTINPETTFVCDGRVIDYAAAKRQGGLREALPCPHCGRKVSLAKGG